MTDEQKPKQTCGWFRCIVRLANGARRRPRRVAIELWWNAESTERMFSGWWVGIPGDTADLQECFPGSVVEFFEYSPRKREPLP